MERKSFRKFLSILLVLCLMSSMAPMTAFAGVNLTIKGENGADGTDEIQTLSDTEFDSISIISGDARLTSTASAITVSGTMDIGIQTNVNLESNQIGTGWNWNAATAVLTLDSSYPNDGIVINCTPDDTINLVLTGNVSIQKTGYTGADRSLWVAGRLNIEAGAYTLNVSSDWSGIRTGGNLTIKSGTVKATGNDMTNGIEVSGDIIIKGNSIVEATGDQDTNGWGGNGLQAGGDILIDTTGTVNTNGGKGGTFTNGNITIENGTVTADGGSHSGMTAANGIAVTGGTVTTNSTGSANGDVKCNLSVSGSSTQVTVNGSIVEDGKGADLIVSEGNVTVTGTVAGAQNLTGGTVYVGGVQVYPISPETIAYPGDALTSIIYIDLAGYSNALAPTDRANGNTVTVNDTAAVTNPGFVFGGYNTAGASTGNTVELNNGATVEYGVFGGYATAGGNAAGNRITMNAGSSVRDVYGGWVNGTGSASGNTVTIHTGAAVDMDVAGGFLASSNGVTADNNIVVLHKDVQVGGDVWGGSRFGASSVGSDNILKLMGAGQQVGRYLNGFQILDIALPAAAADGSTVITVGDTADIDGVTVKLSFDAAPSFAVGNTITLIDTGVKVIGTPANSTVTAAGYTFGITVESGKLIATVTDAPGGSGNNNRNSGSAPDSPTWSTTVTGNTHMPVTSTVEVKGTVDKKGNLSLDVTDAMVKDAIEKAQAEAKRLGKSADDIAVEIKATATEGKSMTAKIDAAALGKLNTASGGLTITSPVSRFILDAKAVKEAVTQSTGAVTFNAIPVTKLSEAAKALIGNRPVFDFTVSYQKDGKTEYISNFGSGTAMLGIPYTLASDENTDNLYIVYVDLSGEPKLLTDSYYEKGWMIRSGNSLSIYGVGYKAPAPAFTDTAVHWAKDDIDFVVSRRLFSGTSDTAFSPDIPITRGMFVTVLWRLAGEPEFDEILMYANYADVKQSSYYEKAVGWASKNNIVNGYEGGFFKPDNSITREEMAVIMQNHAKAAGYIFSEVEDNDFADNASISPWAEAAVKAIRQAGIIVGKDGNRFDPRGNATRAEAAAILRRYVELVINRTQQGIK